MFENPRRGRQAKTFTTTVPKILDLKSSSEQIFSENCRWVPLKLLRASINELSFAQLLAAHVMFVEKKGEKFHF